jgi:streptomycin 6-kinase
VDDVQDVQSRVRSAAQAWRVTVDEWLETDSSVVAYGHRGADPVVLKVVKAHGDEWRSGEVAAAFGGRGVVRVLEHVGGAVLLERARPGRGLFELTRDSHDASATAILADVIAAMVPNAAPAGCSTVADWGRGFARYRASGDRQIAPALVTEAAAVQASLEGSQRNARLLHGDLQHYNVIEDRDRGWLAIDPKGVVGEVEIEIAAGLRNPADFPSVFADPVCVERRVTTFASRLALDADRILRWAFALGVLSAVWHVEDGHVLAETNAPLSLVRAVQAVLGRPALRATQ